MQHMEVYSMLCASLAGGAGFGGERLYKGDSMTESLCCSPETITTL